MQRTYKSKKDTGDGLDYRDMLLNGDEKSSAFDAFFIKNIKQAKRELSCVRTSNQFNATSKNVRKRKYVKRIVKEVQTAPRESSEYLTPDKSIHVKKAPDIFDQLLNSSVQKFGTPTTSRNDFFDKRWPKMKEKTYGKKKHPNIKKFNYSSDGEDSDKENEVKNTTNYNDHDLFIVKESTQVAMDDSSIILIEKKITKFDQSLEGTAKSTLLKNRLTRHLYSPLNSPLCSTPYRDKYRGKSIYNFSPIPVTNIEEVEISSDEGNYKNKSIKPSTSHAIATSPIICLSTDIKKDYNETKLSIKKQGEEYCFDSEVQNIYRNSKDFTEDEPFVGFTNYSTVKNAVKCSVLEKIIEKNIEEMDASDKSIKHDNLGDNKETIQILKSYTISDIDDTHSSDVENKSLYDTANSENSFEDNVKVPIVQMEKLNDSLFWKYYNKKYEIDDQLISNSRTHDYVDSKEDIGKEHQQHLDSMIVNNSLQQNNTSIENNISSNVSTNEDNSLNIENISESDTSLNTLESSPVSIGERIVNGKDNFYSSDLGNNTNNYNETVLSNNDSKTDDNEERFISFVNTRRRNDYTNKTSITMLDDSFESTFGSDFDRTVLSKHNKLGEICVSPQTVQDTDKVDMIVVNDNTLNNDIKTVDNINEISAITIIDEVLEKVDKEINLNNSKTALDTQRESIQDIKSRNQIRSPINTRRTTRNSKRHDIVNTTMNSSSATETNRPSIMLQPGKKWERSLSIYRRMTMMNDCNRSILEDEYMHSKGRKYRQSVISTIEMQDFKGSLHNASINSRRSTFVSKPSRSTIRIVKEPNNSRLSLCTTYDDLKGFLEDCDDTIIELSKLSIADSDHEVTIVDKFHDTSNRISTARDYVLRRCNQTETLLFDECYPDADLKNCRKIGEGVYGEVFLWRAQDGRARVMKIVPIAGNVKVNGECQKDFHEIISEIVIAMELSALRAPIADIERQLDEGREVDALDLHAIANATDVFNEVLAVHCVYGSYPSRLLDLWELYDESKGSENDNPAVLPADQQYVVLELANAGQDLESYQFNGAEQAYALFIQVAFGLAVGEEAYQFEHRDLHWGNVLIAPTDQKFATYVVRGRSHRVARCGVAATIIDYSLSRLSLPLAPADSAALYNDLAADDGLFDAAGDYQFTVYRLMREKLANDWKNFEPYTNILWLHYTVDKMITSLRYKRTNTKIHKHYISRLKAIRNRILTYGSAVQFVLTDNEF